MAGSLRASRPGSAGILQTRAASRGAQHRVDLIGELDASSRQQAVDACTANGHVDVIVDVSRLAFLDCAGYRGLVAAAADLGRRDGSLVLLDPTGEPLRLLALIVELGEALCVPVRFSRPGGAGPEEASS